MIMIVIVTFVNRLEISGSSWANMRIGIFVYHKFQEEIQVMHCMLIVMHGNDDDDDGIEETVILPVSSLPIMR